MRNTNAALGAALLTIAALPLALGQTASRAGQLPAGYVGAETCQACHEDIFNGYVKSPHHAIDSEKWRGWEGRACEACHGPGQKHADSADASLIRNPAKLDPAAVDKICLTCHLNQPTQVGRLGSGHMKDGVACTSCHKVHENGGKDLVARTATTINTLCSSCHVSVWAQFQRPNHHKLPEGAMSCVDCHNPHGTTSTAMTTAFGANEPGCFRCHGDKRGPFSFEHEPVRFEGCQACHEVHGSANPRMLTRQEVRLVCLECHANLPTGNRTGTIGVVPPAFHDLRSPVFQNCTVCHQKVHGSYIDRNLLK
jgi:DmsE family decaheme c-type cytochrome